MPISADPLPLVVDLDGTLVKTDLLVETANLFLIRQPSGIFKIFCWLIEGKTVLKTHLAQSSKIDVAGLPYNEELLVWLREEKSLGRRVVMATASHKLLAEQVALHLGVFDEVLATESQVNLKGQAKRDALVERFGEKNFDYVGDSWDDFAVWQSARTAHVVSNCPRLIRVANTEKNLGRLFGTTSPTVPSAMFQAMRPHQWAKNLLLFIPLLASQRYTDGASLLLALLAFAIFCTLASSVYLLNDLVDVVDDRHHLRKRQRPFAAGQLHLIAGWISWPILLILAFVFSSWWMPKSFTVSLAAYFLCTMAYSLHIKKIPILDVLVLAALYTLRVIAGTQAIAMPMSFWLLSFSMFFFLSLAFIKRYSELKSACAAEQSGTLRGRGYSPNDLALVSNLGASAGYTSVLVLALYIQDGHTAALYSAPHYIWLACPLLMYWISRIWMIAHRGDMHDDPIMFAVKDGLSWAMATLLVLIFTAATLGPPW